MKPFIPPDPVLPARWLLPFPARPGRGATNEGLLPGRRLMTYSGSAALAAAARGLKQTERTKLLAPSYNCGFEIEPFFREGFEIDVYRVDHAGRVDLADLESRLQESHQVVLATHYFGFETDMGSIRALCEANGAYLIEDCAHAFMSSAGDKYLGETGDVSIFSFWKSLPIPDGGCLVINNPSIPSVPPRVDAPFLPVYERMVRALTAGWSVRARTPLARDAIQIARKAMIAPGRLMGRAIGKDGARFAPPDINSLDFDSSVLDLRMSRLSQSILTKVDPQAMKRRRRENYLYVQDALGDLRHLRPLFERLPDGICPLGFPLVPPREYPNAREVMREARPIYRWWPLFHQSVRWEQFPESEWLKRNCFIIEIHQDMETRHLDYLIDKAHTADQAMGRR